MEQRKTYRPTNTLETKCDARQRIPGKETHDSKTKQETKKTTRKKMNKEEVDTEKTRCLADHAEATPTVRNHNTAPQSFSKFEAVKKTTRALVKPKALDEQKIKKNEEIQYARSPQTHQFTSKSIKLRSANKILTKTTTDSRLPAKNVTESPRDIDDSSKSSTVDIPKLRDAQEGLSSPFIKDETTFQSNSQSDNSTLEMSQEHAESCQSPRFSHKTRSISVPEIFPPFDSLTAPLSSKQGSQFSYSAMFHLSSNSLASVPESTSEDFDEATKSQRLSVSTHDISQYDSGDMSPCQNAGSAKSAGLGFLKGQLPKCGLSFRGLSDSGHGSLGASDTSASIGDLYSRSWSSASDANRQSKSRHLNVLAVPESEHHSLEWQACFDESWKRPMKENHPKLETVAFYSESNEKTLRAAEVDSEALEMHSKYISASCPSLNMLPSDYKEQQLSVTDETLGAHRIAQGHRLSMEESYRATSNKDTDENPWGKASLEKKSLVKDFGNTWNRMKSGSESTLSQNHHYVNENLSSRTFTMPSHSPSILRMLQRGTSLSMSKLHVQNSRESGLDKLHQGVSGKHYRSMDDVVFDQGHFRVVHFKAPEPSSRVKQWATTLSTPEQKQEKTRSLVKSDDQGFRTTDIHFPEENPVTASIKDQSYCPNQQSRDFTESKTELLEILASDANLEGPVKEISTASGDLKSMLHNNRDGFSKDSGNHLPQSASNLQQLQLPQSFSEESGKENHRLSPERLQKHKKEDAHALTGFVQNSQETSNVLTGVQHERNNSDMKRSIQFASQEQYPEEPKSEKEPDKDVKTECQCHNMQDQGINFADYNRTEEQNDDLSETNKLQQTGKMVFNEHKSNIMSDHKNPQLQMKHEILEERTEDERNKDTTTADCDGTNGDQQNETDLGNSAQKDKMRGPFMDATKSDALSSEKQEIKNEAILTEHDKIKLCLYGGENTNRNAQKTGNKENEDDIQSIEDAKEDIVLLQMSDLTDSVRDGKENSSISAGNRKETKDTSLDQNREDRSKENMTEKKKQHNLGEFCCSTDSKNQDSQNQDSAQHNKEKIKDKLYPSEGKSEKRDDKALKKEDIKDGKGGASGDKGDSASESKDIKKSLLNGDTPEINMATCKEKITDDLQKKYERKEDNKIQQEKKNKPRLLCNRTSENGNEAQNEGIKTDPQALEDNANSDTFPFEEEITDHMPSGGTTGRRVMQNKFETKKLAIAGEKDTGSPQLHVTDQDDITQKELHDCLPNRDDINKHIVSSQEVEMKDHLPAEDETITTNKDEAIHHFSRGDVRQKDNIIPQNKANKGNYNCEASLIEEHLQLVNFPGGNEIKGDITMLPMEESKKYIARDSGIVQNEGNEVDFSSLDDKTGKKENPKDHQDTTGKGGATQKGEIEGNLSSGNGTANDVLSSLTEETKDNLWSQYQTTGNTTGQKEEITDDLSGTDDTANDGATPQNEKLVNLLQNDRTEKDVAAAPKEEIISDLILKADVDTEVSSHQKEEIQDHLTSGNRAEKDGKIVQLESEILEGDDLVKDVAMQQKVEIMNLNMGADKTLRDDLTAENGGFKGDFESKADCVSGGTLPVQEQIVDRFSRGEAIGIKEVATCREENIDDFLGEDASTKIVIVQDREQTNDQLSGQNVQGRDMEIENGSDMVRGFVELQTEENGDEPTNNSQTEGSRTTQKDGEHGEDAMTDEQMCYITCRNKPDKDCKHYETGEALYTYDKEIEQLEISDEDELHTSRKKAKHTQDTDSHSSTAEVLGKLNIPAEHMSDISERPFENELNSKMLIRKEDDTVSDRVTKDKGTDNPDSKIVVQNVPTETQQSKGNISNAVDYTETRENTTKQADDERELSYRNSANINDSIFESKTESAGKSELEIYSNGVKAQKSTDTLSVSTECKKTDRELKVNFSDSQETEHAGAKEESKAYLQSEKKSEEVNKRPNSEEDNKNVQNKNEGLQVGEITKQKDSKVDLQSEKQLNENDLKPVKKVNEDDNSIKVLPNANELTKGADNEEPDECTLNALRELGIEKCEEKECANNNENLTEKQGKQAPLSEDCLRYNEEQQRDTEKGDRDIIFKIEMKEDEKIKEAKSEDNSRVTNITDTNCNNNERENYISECQESDKNECWKQVPSDECNKDDCILVDAFKDGKELQTDDRVTKQEKRKLEQETDIRNIPNKEEGAYLSTVNGETGQGVNDLNVGHSAENNGGKDHWGCRLQTDQKDCYSGKDREGRCDNSLNAAVEFIQEVKDEDRKYDYSSNASIEVSLKDNDSRNRKDDCHSKASLEVGHGVEDSEGKRGYPGDVDERSGNRLKHTEGECDNPREVSHEEDRRFGESSYQKKFNAGYSQKTEDKEVKSYYPIDVNKAVSQKSKEPGIGGNHSSEADQEVAERVQDEKVKSDCHVGEDFTDNDQTSEPVLDVHQTAENRLETNKAVLCLDSKEEANNDYPSEAEPDARQIVKEYNSVSNNEIDPEARINAKDRPSINHKPHESDKDADETVENETGRRLSTSRNALDVAKTTEERSDRVDFANEVVHSVCQTFEDKGKVGEGDRHEVCVYSSIIDQETGRSTEDRDGKSDSSLDLELSQNVKDESSKCARDPNMQVDRRVDCKQETSYSQSHIVKDSIMKGIYPSKTGCITGQTVEDRQAKAKDCASESDLKVSKTNKDRCRMDGLLVGQKDDADTASSDEEDENNDCSEDIESFTQTSEKGEKCNYFKQQKLSFDEFFIETNQVKDSRKIETREHKDDLQMITSQSKDDVNIDQDGRQYTGQTDERSSYTDRDWIETTHLKQGANNSVDDAEDEEIYGSGNRIEVIYEEDENGGSHELYGGNEEYGQEGYDESLELQQESAASTEMYGDSEVIVLQDEDNLADELNSDEDELDVKILNNEQQQSSTCTTALGINPEQPGMLNLKNFVEGTKEGDTDQWDFSDAESKFRHRKALGTKFTKAENLSAYDVSDDIEADFLSTESVQSDDDEVSTSRGHWLRRRPDWQKWLSASDLEYTDPQEWYDGRSLSSDCILLPNQYATKATSVESITYVFVGADILWPIRRPQSVPANALTAQRPKQCTGDSQFSSSLTALNETKRRMSLPGNRSTQTVYKHNSNVKAMLQMGASNAVQKTNQTSNISTNDTNRTKAEQSVSFDFAQQASENHNHDIIITEPTDFNSLISVQKAQTSDEIKDYEEAAHNASVKEVSKSLNTKAEEALIPKQQHKLNDLTHNIPDFDRQEALKTCRIQDQDETKEINKPLTHVETNQDTPAGNLLKSNPLKTHSKIPTERHSQYTQTVNRGQDLNWLPFPQLGGASASRSNRISFRTAFSQTDIAAGSQNLLPYLSHPNLHGLQSSRTIETQTYRDVQVIATQTSPAFQNSQTQFKRSPSEYLNSDLYDTDGQESIVKSCPSPLGMENNLGIRSALPDSYELDDNKSNDQKYLEKTASILSSLLERNEARSTQIKSDDNNTETETRYDCIMHKPFCQLSFEGTEMNDYTQKSENSNSVTNIPSDVGVAHFDSKADLSAEEIHHVIGSSDSFTDIKLKTVDLLVTRISRDNPEEQETKFTRTKLDFSLPLTENTLSNKKLHQQSCETLVLSNKDGSDAKNGESTPNSEDSFRNSTLAFETDSSLPLIYGEPAHVLQRRDIKELSHCQHNGSEQLRPSWKPVSSYNPFSSSIPNSKCAERCYSNKAGNDRNVGNKINIGIGLTSVKSVIFSQTSLDSNVNVRDPMVTTTHDYRPPKFYNKWKKIRLNGQKNGGEAHLQHSKFFSNNQKKRYLTRAGSFGNNSDVQMGSHLTWSKSSYSDSTKGSFRAQKENHSLAEVVGNYSGFLKGNYQTRNDRFVNSSDRLEGSNSTWAENFGISSEIQVRNNHASEKCSGSKSYRQQAGSLDITKHFQSYLGNFKGCHHIHAESSRPKYMAAFKHHEKPQSLINSSAVHEYDGGELERLRKERRRLLGLLVKDVTASKMRVEYAELQLNYQIGWTEQLLQEMNEDDDDADFLL